VTEAAVQQQVRLEAPRRNWHLWRNNSGAGKLENGSFLRWGLANDSEQLNKRLKSSDLIGIDETGKFLAIECKPPGWRLTPGDARGHAQLAFINLVLAKGGRAGFVTSIHDLDLL
jgi:hypothetical protein